MVTVCFRLLVIVYIPVGVDDQRRPPVNYDAAD